MDVVASLDLADRILALQAVRMFSAVDIGDLQQIAESLVEKRYEPGETIFSRGDWEDDMILVVAGEVHLAGDVEIPPRGPGEHRAPARPPGAPAAAQPFGWPEPVQHELGRSLGAASAGGLTEVDGRPGEGRDHQPVPSRQDLLVA